MSTLNPTTPGQRIRVLDSLRGFALFGIMFVNMTWFTGFFAVFIPGQSVQLTTLSVDVPVYWLIDVLVAGKFWSLFALLFGVGMQLSWSKGEKSGQVWLVVRRLTSLLLIGLGHAVFIWFGDIVSLYAATGFALLLFHRASNRAVLFWAFVFLLLPIVHNGIWLLVKPGFDASHGPLELLPAFAKGNYAEVFAANWTFLAKRWLLVVYSGRFFKLLGLFLLGIWAVRQRVFTEPPRHRRMLTSTLIWGMLIGLPTNAFLATYSTGDFPWLRNSLATIGIPALSLAYAAGFILIYSFVMRGDESETDIRPGPFLILNYIGRMTLTNYVMQSVIGIVVFYGIGFGNWGRIGAAWSVPLVLLILTFQSLFSMIWLRFFRHGPLEWLWRCMTYGRLLPIRID